MKVLITGITGFIGGSLAKYFIDFGYQVIGIGRSLERLDDYLIDSEGFKSVSIDLLTSDLDLLDKDIDVVINLAGASDGKDNWEVFYNANINIVNKLYDWSLENKVGHFIQCSTLSVFGFKANKKVISEEQIPRPSNYYGLSKYFSEILLKMKTNLCLGDMKVTVLRFPSVFGKNNKIGIVEKFIELAKKDLPIDLYSNGILTRNLLYIDDAVKLINKTLVNKEKLNDYELVHIGSSDSLAMIDIAKIIVAKTNSKSSIIPLDKKASVDWDVYLDLSKMHSILEATTLSVNDGILNYLESLGYEV